MNSIIGGRGQSRWPKLAALAASAAFITPALAHPGHELHEHGMGHALTSPDHALVLLAVGLGMSALGYMLRSPRAARALRWGGACALLCGLALRLV